jgi:diguanylate cyclase (GGDEF)-like protein
MSSDVHTQPVDLLDVLLTVHREPEPDPALRAALAALAPAYGQAYVMRLTIDRAAAAARVVSFAGSDGPVFARMRHAGCPVPGRLSAGALLPPSPVDPAAGAVRYGGMRDVLGGAFGDPWCAGAERELGVASATLAPVVVDEMPQGMVILLCSRGWTEPVARAVVAHAAVAVANSVRRQELQRSAEIDPETLVHNHRHFESALARELSRAARYHHSVSLVIVESVTQGLNSGQLRAIAAHLFRTVRRSDTVGRVDGAGFALILPETGAAGALTVISRLAERAERDGLELRAGSATHPDDGRSWNELLVAATSRQRRIKGAGAGRGKRGPQPAGVKAAGG